MKVLITGANGYIGARLAVFLLKRGIKLRLSTRKPLSPLKEFEGAESTILDFSDLDYESLKHACEGVDTIIHLAALNDKQCRESPQLSARVNTKGTGLLVKAAANNRVKQFIYFSTAHVYGDPTTEELTEESPTRPASQYAITHVLAEDHVLASDVPQKFIFRLSNGVGAPLFPETNCWMLLVNDLCKQAVTTGKLVLKSHGLQLRNFISLSQVEKIVTQSLTDLDLKPTSNTFNLIGTTLSVQKMALEIKARAEIILGQNIELICPNATVEEEEWQKSKSLRIKSRWPFYSPESARLELTNAIDETVLFCKENF